MARRHISVKSNPNGMSLLHMLRVYKAPEEYIDMISEDKNYRLLTKYSFSETSFYFRLSKFIKKHHEEHLLSYLNKGDLKGYNDYVRLVHHSKDGFTGAFDTVENELLSCIYKAICKGAITAWINMDVDRRVREDGLLEDHGGSVTLDIMLE